MIKLEVHPQVLMSLNQAFPKPNMAATKALNKYVRVLEKLLFEAWLHGPTPGQRKLKLLGLSLYQLMAKGGQIGPNKIRIHKWLKDQKLELVQAVTKGSNLTGRLSEVKLTDLVNMTNTLELKEEITMNIHNITERELSAYLTSDDAANQALFDLLYPDYDERWTEEHIRTHFDPVKVDMRSLENYIVWLSTEATMLTKDKKATAMRQARMVLGCTLALNGWYLQRKKPSAFGRMYYEGVSVQNVNKALRAAMLGNCWEYDIRSSVVAWKMGFATPYLTQLPAGHDADIRSAFPCTLNYLEDRGDFMRTVRLYVFHDLGKDLADFQMKLLKQAFTVTYTVVTPRRCCSRRISARALMRNFASRLDKGSSNRKACGSRTMASLLLVAIALGFDISAINRHLSLDATLGSEVTGPVRHAAGSGVEQQRGRRKRQHTAIGDADVQHLQVQAACGCEELEVVDVTLGGVVQQVAVGPQKMDIAGRRSILPVFELHRAGTGRAGTVGIEEFFGAHKRQW